MKKYFFQNREGAEEYWISVSDMMSGLMMIFLLIAVIYRIDIQDKTNQIEKVHRNICNELRKEFKDDKDKWNMSICQGGLVVSFQNEAVFKKGSSQLQPRFKKILDNFFPKFMTIVIKNKSQISELRIEGHTSSEYTKKSKTDSYILNTELSQKRSYNVMKYVFNKSSKKVAAWMTGNLTAHGMSSSKLIYQDNDLKKENPNKSRRVEFRIQTNAEAKLIDDLKIKIKKTNSDNQIEANPIILQKSQGIILDNNQILETNTIPNNIGQRYFCEINYRSTQKIVKFKEIITLYKSDNEVKDLDQSWIQSGFSKGVEYSKNYEKKLSVEDGFIYTELALEENSLNQVTIDYLHDEEIVHQCKFILEESTANQIEDQLGVLPEIILSKEIDEAKPEPLRDEVNLNQTFMFSYDVAKNGMNLYWTISNLEDGWWDPRSRLITHCQQQQIICSTNYQSNIENDSWDGERVFNASGLAGNTERCIAASYFISKNSSFQNLIISTGPDAYSANAKALKICTDNNGYPDTDTCFVPKLENVCGESKGIYKFKFSESNNSIIEERSKETPAAVLMPIPTPNQEELANQEKFGGLEDSAEEPKSFFDKLFSDDEPELKPSAPQIGQ